MIAEGENNSLQASSQPARAWMHIGICGRLSSREDRLEADWRMVKLATPQRPPLIYK